MAILLVIIFRYFFKTGSYKARGALWLIALYLMTISFYVVLGPHYARSAWLILLVVMNALLFGTRAAVGAIILNVIILMTLYWTMGPESIAWENVYEASFSKWIMFVVNVSVLSISCGLPVGFLLKKLDISLTHERESTQNLSEESKKLKQAYDVLQKEIQERKDAEVEKQMLESQLLQAQKMEAVGTLAGGIAHDFNNSLQGILGYIQILLLDMQADAPEVRKLRQVEASALRAGELTKQLLTFSRKIESKLQPINLNQEVRQFEKLLRRIIPRMISIELHTEGRLHVINADSSQIEQLMMNLSINARDAMPQGGKLTIGTENRVLDEAYCRTHFGTVPGNYVVLSISDNGSGIDKETMQRIYDPFYTTKELGKGTGLGLAMVYGIVKSHGGHIMCHSELGQGTTFQIFFPEIEEVYAKQPGQYEQTKMKGGTETILLVDDEESLRDLGKTMLRRFGYTVLEASHGEMALEVYAGKKEEISLILLDLIMPGMGGQKCLEKILKMDPSQKVIIASGYSTDSSSKDVLQMGAKNYIEKPFQVGKLLTVVRQVLDQG